MDAGAPGFSHPNADAPPTGFDDRGLWLPSEEARGVWLEAREDSDAKIVRGSTLSFVTAVGVDVEELTRLEAFAGRRTFMGRFSFSCLLESGFESRRQELHGPPDSDLLPGTEDVSLAVVGVE